MTSRSAVRVGATVLVGHPGARRRHLPGRRAPVPVLAQEQLLHRVRERLQPHRRQPGAAQRRHRGQGRGHRPARGHRRHGAGLDHASIAATQQRIRQDSQARIQTLGLLGDKYIAINSGSPGLPADRARRPDRGGAGDRDRRAAGVRRRRGRQPGGGGELALQHPVADGARRGTAGSAGGGPRRRQDHERHRHRHPHRRARRAVRHQERQGIARAPALRRQPGPRPRDRGVRARAARRQAQRRRRAVAGAGLRPRAQGPVRRRRSRTWRPPAASSRPWSPTSTPATGCCLG